MNKFFLALVIVVSALPGFAYGNFICAEDVLYNGQTGHALYTFDFASQCNDALRTARNDFICAEEHLFSSTSQAELYDYSFATLCIDALNVSRPGRICAEDRMYLSGSNQYLQYNSNFDCQTAIDTAR